MDFKIGDKVYIKSNSIEYTGQYAGSVAEVYDIFTEITLILKGYDNQKFLCPSIFIETYKHNIQKRKCECGAKHTCTPNIHLNFCPLHKNNTIRGTYGL